jgi:hypothetical protein
VVLVSLALYEVLLHLQQAEVQASGASRTTAWPGCSP